MWEMTGEDVSDIETQFLLEQDMKNADIKYFKELLHQVPAHVKELDERISPLLDRPFHELDPVECAIMRLGVYELQHRIDIPYRVVINEAVELAKIFGAEEGHKYVNSILDRVAKKIRSIEVNAKRSSSNR
jgi:N utilization substance protein B